MGIDNLRTGFVKNLEGIACDFHQVDAGEADYSHSDAIVHAAAAPDVSGNWTTEQARADQWLFNAELTRRVLDRAPSGIPFVLISTCSVYAGGTVDERTVPRATSPYAASKLAAEALVCAYDEAGRVKGSILRLVNVVGARYAHGHLADFVKAATTGHVHALDNGEKAKSFVHVDDVADAIGETLAAFDASRGPLLRNVTSPQCWSWRDSINVMRRMRPDRDFNLTCEKGRSGWIGDPESLVVRSVHNERRLRSIWEGVEAALVSLGWSE